MEKHVNDDDETIYNNLEEELSIIEDELIIHRRLLSKFTKDHSIKTRE
jgi:hypothetical protein